jgi:hypothetical protein
MLFLKYNIKGGVILKVKAFFNAILGILPNTSITAMLVSSKGVVCPKLDIVLN